MLHVRVCAGGGPKGPSLPRPRDCAMWATGESVSTIGLDKQAIRQYIRDQEKRDSGQGATGLKQSNGPSGAYPTCAARLGGPS